MGDSVRWIDKRDKWDEFFRMLGRRLDGHSIQLGFTEETGAAQYENGLTVAEVAAMNEFGTRTIPARAFLRDTIDSHDNFRKEIRAGIRSIPWGTSPEKALETLGETAVAALRETIEKWSTPPNAASTIRKKGADDPLVDSRMLLGAVTYKVVKK